MVTRVFVIVCVLIAIVLGGYYYFRHVPPIKVVDRLCEFVRNEQQMECVSVFAADTFMKPGAIVEVRMPTGDGVGRVSLPVADLFGPKCIVRGADAVSLQKGTTQPQPISIPQLTYETNRALELGADVEIPQLEGSSFKAGPRWSDVSKIVLGVDDAWVTGLDEISAVDAYKSCLIITTCAEYIRSARYRVVGTAVVAKGLSYKVYNKRGEIISLQAAAQSGQFTANFGGKTDVGGTTDATIKAGEPRVVGVRLMPDAVFSGEQICREATMIQHPTAMASVSLVGGGGKGNIGPMQSDTKPIGQTARLSMEGTEASECDDDFERKKSAALAEARVDEAGVGEVRFNYRLRAQGGHYVTAARCLDKLIVDKTGHDTSATAAAELKARIAVLIRSESSPNLHISWQEVPPGTNIQVLDYRNQPLKIPRRVIVRGDPTTILEDMPASIAGSGSETFETRGPGQYYVDATLQLNASVTGNADEPKEGNASIRVAVAP